MLNECIWDSAKYVAFVEGCPHVRGGLYEGRAWCSVMKFNQIL